MFEEAFCNEFKGYSVTTNLHQEVEGLIAAFVTINSRLLYQDTHSTTSHGTFLKFNLACVLTVPYYGECLVCKVCNC